MKFKKIILLSTSIVGLGLLIPTAVRVNEYSSNTTQIGHGQLNKPTLSEGFKLAKPTTKNAPVTFTGINGFGTYSAPEYNNTTVQLFDSNNKPINEPESDLTNYPYGRDTVYVGYTPNKGYSWNDGGKQMIKVAYHVSNLIGITKPTTKNVPIKFTGINYAGTYKVPQYAFTTAQLYDFSGRPINKPESDLSNWPYGMDEIYVGYTPFKNVFWNDGSNQMVKVEYVVHGLPTGLTKPTAKNVPVTFTGFNGRGTYKKPAYKNTTVQLFNEIDGPINEPMTDLRNYPKGYSWMWIGYTPNKGFTWADGTNNMIQVEYFVKGLTTAELAWPTTTNAPIKFTGAKYNSKFSAKYKNTTVQYYDLNDKKVDYPPTNLSDGDEINVGYTPNKGHAWLDGLTIMARVQYIVSGLLPYPIPSLYNNQYHYVKSSEPHDHYDYYLGIGWNDIKQLYSTAFPYWSHWKYGQGDKEYHAACTAPGLSTGAHSHNQLLMTYFHTDNSCAYNAMKHKKFIPFFTREFDSDLSGFESMLFSDAGLQNRLSDYSEWQSAYDYHEGILIHFWTWYPDSAHSSLHALSSIKVADQSLWTKTFDC